MLSRGLLSMPEVSHAAGLYSAPNGIGLVNTPAESDVYHYPDMMR